MIGVDTNVLLRLFVLDDASQHQRAKHFFASRSADDPAYIGIIVLVELVWVLHRTYGYPYLRIYELLRALLNSPDIVIEKATLIEEVIEFAAQPKADFNDALIATLALEAGCSSTVTFDTKASRRIPGMQVLS